MGRFRALSLVQIFHPIQERAYGRHFFLMMRNDFYGGACRVFIHSERVFNWQIRNVSQTKLLKSTVVKLGNGR